MTANLGSEPTHPQIPVLQLSICRVVKPSFMRRLQPSSAIVAELLVDRPDDVYFGYSIMKETGLASGVLYPILRRFEARGWIAPLSLPSTLPADQGDQRVQTQPSRPPRKSYRVVDAALPEMIQELARHEAAQLESTVESWTD